MSVARRRPFLTAAWRYLAMLNYRVDPALLQPLVPEGTHLDSYHGETYVSLVGFLFEDTRLRGVPIPFHRTFEELNLRFYVRREVEPDTRRAVVFIRELVPRPAIALVARLVYNEPYVAVPMRHRITRTNDATIDVEYRWRFAGRWHSLAMRADQPPARIVAGSAHEFIAEHYWGYTRQRNGDTLEYEVQHPRWRVWPQVQVRLDADFSGLYGPAFASILRDPPASTFLAEGSAVTVYPGQRLARAAR